MDERKDLRVYKTKKSLCDAFLDLMREKTFDAITVQELCDRALVRRATFYKHFVDKYDFFSFFIRYYRSQYIENIDFDTDGATPQTYCHYYFECFLSFIDQHRTFMDNILKSNMLPVMVDIFSEEMYAHVLEILKKHEWKDQQNIPAPEILASFYVGGIIQTLRFWIQNPEHSSEDELKKNISALLNAVRLEAE